MNLPSSQPRQAHALLRLLARPRAHIGLSALALVLVSPALAAGFLFDDHVFALLMQRPVPLPGFHGDPLFLFHFTTGRPADNLAMMNSGALLPWWSDPHHLNAFLRPLSSLTHALDFTWFPDAPALMHLHSLLWFAALLLVVAHTYRRLDEPGAFGALAALPFALFALDDAHGMTVAWIANRNALIAATLSLPALVAHHRWVSAGFRPGAYLGPLCFALGLGAGEAALCVFGYLLAYALVLDPRSPRWRALSLAPYVLVLVLWRVVFSALGLGSQGSGVYHDPLREPFGFAFALLDHLPVLLSAQLLLPLADLVFWGAPGAHLPLWLLSAASVAFVGWLAVRLLGRDPLARFWAAGLVLSASVVAASVPGERLLLLPGVGGAALTARLLWALWTRAATPFYRRVGIALGLLHLVAAPLSLPLRVQGIAELATAIDQTDRSLPEAPAQAGEAWIVWNAPFDVMVSYLQVRRASQGRARPAHLHWLATASSPIEATRVGPQRLRVTIEQGYLRTAPERLYRGDPRPLSPGGGVVLDAFEATVREVLPDGRPKVVEFAFREALESPRYRFFRYRDGGMQPEPPPPIGRSLRFSREDFWQTVLHAGLRRWWGCFARAATRVDNVGRARLGHGGPLRLGRGAGGDDDDTCGRANRVEGVRRHARPFGGSARAPGLRRRLAGRRQRRRCRDDGGDGRRRLDRRRRGCVGRHRQLR